MMKKNLESKMGAICSRHGPEAEDSMILENIYLTHKFSSPKKINKVYRMHDIVGSGSFGVVRKATPV